MLRRMYLVSPDYVAVRKQPPTPTTQSPQRESESRKKRDKKKKRKTTKHGRRVTKEQHPYDRWVKMRSEMQEADINKKTITQKIADFLQKVLPNSNAHAEQTMAAPPPPETQDARADFKSEAPDTASRSLPFLTRAHESVFASGIKRSLSMDSDDEGLLVMSPVNQR